MKKGFTIIELLVAIGLFSVIVAIAAGGFTSALRTQRQIASIIAAQSNASLALEEMAREIRTGYLFCHDVNGNPTCHRSNGSLCTANGSVFTCADLNFYNGMSANVTYSLVNGALIRDDGVPQAITGTNVVIRYLTFTLFGNLEGDHWNPRITITMGVAPNSLDPGITNNVLDLETTVSARGIDCSAAAGC